MDFEELLSVRRSVRRYENRQVSDALIMKIIEAGNAAPLGSGLYNDIHITVVQDEKKLLYLCEAAWKRFSTHQKLQEVIGTTINAQKAKEKNLDLFYGAPTVIFVSHRKQTLQPGIEWANVSAVATEMHLEAANLGLGSCLMWGALESMRMLPALNHTGVLNVPRDYEPLIALSLGYPAQDLEPNQKIHEKFTVNFVR